MKGPGLGAMRLLAAVLAVTLAPALATPAAATGGGSLYSGPGPRPGPAILYQPLAVAPQLTNA
ncbi:MAG TPA: hypothetical protein VG245_03270, partial [Candidatus Dormibacteraeota bacterium]|nr:hypothetical protein [Candidatus Dormibacteraeota bacterium]